MLALWFLGTLASQLSHPFKDGSSHVKKHVSNDHLGPRLRRCHRFLSRVALDLLVPHHTLRIFSYSSAFHPPRDRKESSQRRSCQTTTSFHAALPTTLSPPLDIRLGTTSKTSYTKPSQEPGSDEAERQSTPDHHRRNDLRRRAGPHHHLV